MKTTLLGCALSLGLAAGLLLTGCGDDDDGGTAGAAGSSGGSGKGGTGGTGGGASGSGMGSSGSGGSAGTGGGAGASGASGASGAAGGGGDAGGGAGGEAGGGGSGTGGSGTGGSGTGGSGTGGSGTGGSGTGGSGTGGSGTGGSGTGGSGTGGSGTGGSGTGGSSGGVVGTGKNVFRTNNGDVVLPVAPSTWSSVGAVTIDGDKVTSYPGTHATDGTITIPGVPEGPYLIELTSQPTPGTSGLSPLKTYYPGSGPTFSVDQIFSVRPDVDDVSQETHLVVTAPLTRPWKTYEETPDGEIIEYLEDELRYFSRNADVTGATTPGGFFYSGSVSGAPLNGDTALEDWTIDVQFATFGFTDGRAHLVRGDKGDDFALMHGVTEAVTGAPPGPDAPPDPWAYYEFTAVRSAFSPAPFTMSDGGSNTIEGAFVELPAKSFSFDYEGSLFNAQLKDALPAGDFELTVSLTLSMEPGTPQPFIGPSAALLNANAFSIVDYAEPLCTPQFCFIEECPNGCNSPAEITLPGDHVTSFTYGNPFSSGQERVALFLPTRHFVPDELLPPSFVSESLRGGYVIDLPASDLDGQPIVPTLGLPRDIRVEGQPTPLEVVTSGVGLTPEISFEPPTLGTPTSYNIQITELDDVLDGNGNPITFRRRVLSVHTLETGARVPVGVLSPGKHYYVQVSANDGQGAASGSLLTQYQRFVSAQSYTGVFTP